MTTVGTTAALAVAVGQLKHGRRAPTAAARTGSARKRQKPATLGAVGPDGATDRVDVDHAEA